jgi:hypothetical protein
LGDIVNQVAPGVGTQLDQLNHNLGNPVDHTIAAGANAVVPGSGVALEGAWAVQRSGILNSDGFRPAQPGGPAPGLALGNFCATPVGIFGPGPLNPVGSGCNVNTFNGVVFGQVVQR